MNTQQTQADARGKVYRRTDNGVDSLVTVKEALAEVNGLMMGPRKAVKEMSSVQGHHTITYRDGRRVVLTEIDAPEVTPETETSAEPMDWASTRTGNVEHRFGADGRALCSRRYHAHDAPISQTDRRVRRTRSEIERSEYGHLYIFCPKCAAL